MNGTMVVGMAIQDPVQLIVAFYEWSHGSAQGWMAKKSQTVERHEKMSISMEAKERLLHCQLSVVFGLHVPPV